MKTRISVIAVWVLLALGTAFVVKNVVDINSERDARIQAACASENDSRAVLRRILVFSEGRTLASPNITPKEKVQVLAFYNQALKLVPPVHC